MKILKLSPDTHFVWRVCCMLRMVWENVVFMLLSRHGKTEENHDSSCQDSRLSRSRFSWMIHNLFNNAVSTISLITLCEISQEYCECIRTCREAVVICFTELSYHLPRNECRNLWWTSVGMAGSPTEFGTRSLLNTDLKCCCCSSLPILIFEPGTIPVQCSMSLELADFS